jgi:hypothetical protein
MAAKTIDYEQWMAAQLPITECDIMIRRKISDAQVDDLLKLLRNGTSETKYTDVFALIREITFLHLYHSPARDERLRNLINRLESDLDTFKTYADSDAYKINHYDNFKNTKDSTAFYFVG